MSINAFNDDKMFSQKFEYNYRNEDILSIEVVALDFYLFRNLYF